MMENDREVPCVGLPLDIRQDMQSAGFDREAIFCPLTKVLLKSELLHYDLLAYASVPNNSAVRVFTPEKLTQTADVKFYQQSSEVADPQNPNVNAKLWLAGDCLFASVKFGSVTSKYLVTTRSYDVRDVAKRLAECVASFMATALSKKKDNKPVKFKFSWEFVEGQTFYGLRLQMVNWYPHYDQMGIIEIGVANTDNKSAQYGKIYKLVDGAIAMFKTQPVLIVGNTASGVSLFPVEVSDVGEEHLVYDLRGLKEEESAVIGSICVEQLGDSGLIVSVRPRDGTAPKVPRMTKLRFSKFPCNFTCSFDTNLSGGLISQMQNHVQCVGSVKFHADSNVKSVRALENLIRANPTLTNRQVSITPEDWYYESRLNPWMERIAFYYLKDPATGETMSHSSVKNVKFQERVKICGEDLDASDFHILSTVCHTDQLTVATVIAKYEKLKVRSTMPSLKEDSEEEEAKQPVEWLFSVPDHQLRAILLTHYRKFRLLQPVATPRIARNALFECDPDLFGLGVIGGGLNIMDAMDCAAYWFFFLKSVFNFPQIVCLFNDRPSIVYLQGEQVRSCLAYNFRTPPRAIVSLRPGQVTRVVTKYLVCQKHGWMLTDHCEDWSVVDPMDPEFVPSDDIIKVWFDVDVGMENLVESVLSKHNYRLSRDGVRVLLHGEVLRVTKDNLKAFQDHLAKHHGIHSMGRLMEDVKLRTAGIEPYIDVTWVDPLSL